MIVLALLGPLVPGLLWLWFFYSRDRYQPEPKKVVLWTFALGGLSAAPAVFGELAAEGLFPFQQQLARAVLDGQGLPLGTAAALCFLVIGPIEELCKFGATAVYAARHKAFDEPLDGIVYSSAAALGFASVENMLYLAGTGAAGPGALLLLLRGLLAVPGHVLFAAFWGYGLGARLVGPHRPWRLPAMLALAALAHGAWDFVLLVEDARILFLPLSVGLVWTTARFVQWGRRSSPFRPSLLAKTAAAAAPGASGLRCLRCGRTAAPGDRHCTKCGGTVLPAHLTCPSCSAPLVERSDRFCGSCGAQLAGVAPRCTRCATELSDPEAAACPGCDGPAPPA
jgi:RsiW-degrading membrane proteinase PrsW (M82 family)